MINNIKIILTSIGGLIAAAAYIFNKGKQNERNKNTKRVLEKVEATNKRRQKRANDTPADDLKWVLENADD